MLMFLTVDGPGRAVGSRAAWEGLARMAPVAYRPHAAAGASFFPTGAHPQGLGSGRLTARASKAPILSSPQSPVGGQSPAGVREA